MPRSLGSITLDDLEIDSNGYFNLLLSRERPLGHQGNWMPLSPEADTVFVRLAACDWRQEVDPRLAIERVDVPAPRPRPRPEEIAERLSALADWTEQVVSRWYAQNARRRAEGIVNRLEPLQYAATATSQRMFDGCFSLAANEALIIESALPRQCRYWALSMMDDHLTTIDWMNHQSSLNDRQARVDSDGRLRVVVAATDPGVPNWLDTAGYTDGVIQLRWNHASDFPEPVTHLVPIAEVRSHLPADTPIVGPEERDAALRARREGAQLRRRW